MTVFIIFIFRYDRRRFLSDLEMLLDDGDYDYCKMSFTMGRYFRHQVTYDQVMIILISSSLLS